MVKDSINKKAESVKQPTMPKTIEIIKILLIIILIATLCGLGLYYFQLSSERKSMTTANMTFLGINSTLHAANDTLKSQNAELSIENAELRKKANLDTLEKTFTDLEEEHQGLIDGLDDFYYYLYEDFERSKFVIVASPAATTYHDLDCRHLDALPDYYFYNLKYAVRLGLLPDPDCHR